MFSGWGQMEGLMDWQMDGQMDGWTKRRMNERVSYFQTHIPFLKRSYPMESFF